MYYELFFRSALAHLYMIFHTNIFAVFKAIFEEKITKKIFECLYN